MRPTISIPPTEFRIMSTGVAESIDSAYAILHTHLGYAVPPSDGSAGGDDKYDIYILEMPNYGLTQPESPGPESWDDYTSYMAINNNFIGFSAQ